jgi:hypothetical protein
MEHIMHSPAELATQYLAVWNETDSARRRELIEQTFNPAASYQDPLMEGQGHDGIAAMIAAAQSQFPGHRFTLHGTPDGYKQVVRFSWALGLPGSEPVAYGTDVALTSGGRFDSIAGFLDTAQAQPA